MQLTSSPRRALGLLAATTIGLSTALVGITGTAGAVPVTVPNAPIDVDVYGGDGTLDVWFNPNDPAEEDLDTPWSETWEYSLASSGGAGNTSGFEEVEPEYASGLLRFELDGLTNGTEYTIVLRGVGVDGDDEPLPGAESEPEKATPFKAIGAPGSPTVTVGPSSLKVSWTAPSTTGTYALAGYEVLADLDLAPGAQMGGPTTICETTAATTSCTAPVKAGRAYTVEVHAIDADGYGSDATPVTSAVVPMPTVPATVPAKNGDLTLPAGTSSTVAAGKTITVSGSGYAPMSSVTLAIYSAPQVLTTVVTDASGNFTATVTIPAGLAAGNHTLVASGVDSNGVVRYVSVPVTVSASGTASTGAKLANTGADVTLPALGGIATLGLGAGLIAISRRRRTAA